MKTITRVLLLSLGMAQTPALFAAGDAKAGEALAATCMACHGSGGNSTAPNFPKLAGQGEKYLIKQMKEIKTGVRVVPEMAGILANSSDADMANLAAYFSAQTQQLSGSKALTVQVNSGEKVDALKLGAKVFRAGNASTGVPACTGCHSPKANGNAPAGYPRLGGQHAAYLEKQLKDFRAGNRTNDGEAKPMRQAAAQLSDAEITALANFIAGLH